MTVTATPATNSPALTVLWTGCGSTLGTSCMVTMTGNLSVTATVDAESGSGSLSTTLGQLSCTLGHFTPAFNGTLQVAGTVGSNTMAGVLGDRCPSPPSISP